MAERVWRVGDIYLEPLKLSENPDDVNVVVISWRNGVPVRAAAATIGLQDLLEALADMVAEKPRLLMEKRRFNCGYYGCDTALVPNRELIVDVIFALRHVLAAGPRRRIVGRDDDDHIYNIWSDAEARAAAKAAVLLDIAAMLLRKPELVDKLPNDVEMMIKQHEQGTLWDFVKEESNESEKAEARG